MSVGATPGARCRTGSNMSTAGSRRISAAASVHALRRPAADSAMDSPVARLRRHVRDCPCGDEQGDASGSRAFSRAGDSELRLRRGILEPELISSQMWASMQPFAIVRLVLARKPRLMSLYQSSVPTFERSLAAFLGVLDKAEAHAEARKFDATNYLALRLAPDMFPLTRQIQTFCDHAKNASFRLAGVAPPVIEDKETTLPELRARIQATLEHLKTLDAAAIDAASDREIVIPLGANKAK